MPNSHFANDTDDWTAPSGLDAEVFESITVDMRRSTVLECIAAERNQNARASLANEGQVPDTLWCDSKGDVSAKAPIADKNDERKKKRAEAEKKRRQGKDAAAMAKEALRKREA